MFHADVHARRYARLGERLDERAAGGDRVPGDSREHVSLGKSPRGGRARQSRRSARVHELASSDAHRQRRVPDGVAA